jgi:hypothetical protein
MQRSFTLIFIFVCIASARAAPDVTRMWFTPPVVPTNYTQTVRFEAAVTENPASVAFEYNGVDRPMNDSGINGDRAAGDGIWTTLFQPGEITNKLTAASVFRPFIGYCKPAGSGRFNIFAEVWTSAIGLAPIRTIDSASQETDYIINFVATTSQLTNFSASFWANRFYSVHQDKFDFLNFVHVAGLRGNRYHFAIRNSVTGIGLASFNDTALYGSAGRLQGCTIFPLSSFFDAGAPTFSHEMGHQWMNFLSGTPYAAGTPHWPVGDIAINVMGFSIAGSGAGGGFNYTFTTNAQGGFTTGPANPTNNSTFNSMELYLMGLLAPSQVKTYFIFTNQNVTPTNGQVFSLSELTLVPFSSVTATQGTRAPDSTNSQKTFRCATVVLSEQLLDANAMSFYDWFARRAEARQPASYADGFATGTGNPFYLATGGRAVMFSKIKDDQPTLAIKRLPNADEQITFTGKVGIVYQLQSSTNLTIWSNDGASTNTPVFNPPADAAISLTRTPPPGPSRSYRLSVGY